MCDTNTRNTNADRDRDSDRKCSSISDTVLSAGDYPVIDSDDYDR